MSKVIVVGGGLFGAIAAQLATKCGATVITVFPGLQGTASAASGCLLKPSWLSSLSKNQIAVGYEVLEHLYGIHKLKFVGPLGKKVSVDWVDPATILKPASVVGRVESIGNGFVVLSNGTKLDGKVLLAAGPECSTLLPSLPPIQRLMGISLRFAGQIKEPRIHIWAPYRQALAFNISNNEIWFGDGTSIREHNWKSAERIDAATRRAEQLFGLKDPCAVYVGARPYVVGHKAGYFQRVYPNTWVSTGGAKNGTLLAAYQAQRFCAEALGL